MNFQMIKYILGIAMLIVSILLLFPLGMSLFEGDLKIIIAFAVSWLLTVLFTYVTTRNKPKRKSIYAKDGFVIVGLTWVLISFFGALPYVFSGAIPNLIDALYESVSGFTTTGGSVIADVEILPRSILLWRSMTHWIGGLGVLVFIMSIVSFAGGNSMYLMRAEASAPSGGKMAPKIKKTAIITYSIYAGITFAVFILMLFGNIGWFDSLTNAFSVVATGGFSVRNASIAYYNSPYIEWVLTAFMFLCSINFNLFYLLILRKFSTALKNEELRVFAAIFFVSLLFTVFELNTSLGGDWSDNIRYAAFQLASVVSTTGFAAVDYAAWPPTIMALFLVLTLLGGCSASTAGGAKVVRLIYVVKSMRREIRKMLHPNAVEVVKFSGKPVDEEAVSGVMVFFVAYTLLILFSLLLVSVDGFDLKTTLSSVIVSVGNTGLGFGDVGPGGNFAGFSVLSKLVFIIDMLCGRLSIFPILFLFLPSMWSKRKNIQRMEI